MSSLTSPKRRALYRTEKQFQSQVEQFALTLGWFPFHINLPMRSQAGFPDLMLLKDRVVWIELKAYHANGKAGRVMPEQETFHTMLREAGQEVYVIFDDDDGWAVIKRVLSDGRLT